MKTALSRLDSWGRVDRRARQSVPFGPGTHGLPFGLGRSYGDSCHDDEGVLATVADHAGIIDFDASDGVLTAKAGTSLRDIINATLPFGWFPYVVPGTQFVTLGGAIANDVHGKNHHRRGTFGRYVTALDLVRSDEGTRTLNPNDPLFRNVVGGMGLSGIIERATLQLMRVPGAQMRQKAEPFGSIDEFIDRSVEDCCANEYSVAWVDALADGKQLGQGIVLNGNHVSSPDRSRTRALNVPFTPPFSPLNKVGIAVFNKLYRYSTLRRPDRSVSARAYFFPLDGITNWNRLYGPRGLHQHQCVVPAEAAREVLPELLRAAQDANHPSFLTVLKRFGDLVSPGSVSFPREGFTLTLDFANRGTPTLNLLNRLDAIVTDAGGRTNAYKDARMSGNTFRVGQPRWHELEATRDPVIDSNFWRRVVPAGLRTGGWETAA